MAPQGRPSASRGGRCERNEDQMASAAGNASGCWKRLNTRVRRRSPTVGDARGGSPEWVDRYARVTVRQCHYAVPARLTRASSKMRRMGTTRSTVKDMRGTATANGTAHVLVQPRRCIATADPRTLASGGADHAVRVRRQFLMRRAHLVEPTTCLDTDTSVPPPAAEW